METLLNVPQGGFQLQRLPCRKNEKLKAWDAADEYLLNHVYEQVGITEDSQVLILNDKFGALVCGLHAFNPVAITDSWLSQQATRSNIASNNLSGEDVILKNSLDWPKQTFDLVLIKIPKTLALLEDQIIRLQAVITENTIIIAAGMIKAMSANVWKLLEKYLGQTKPSLAKKKARLIFVETNTSLQKSIKSPYPVYYQLEHTEYKICNHANVFSRDSLDIGTRFLLQHLPSNKQTRKIVDLGCGNGIVGLMLAEANPTSHLYFVDESYMAIASAKESFSNAFPEIKADFYVADGLTNFEAETVDLIVCNPPFHQQNTVGNQIAISMFKQSYRVLKKGGELRVIGNRHLGYHIDLRRIFGNCIEVVANKKFVIWKVIK